MLEHIMHLSNKSMPSTPICAWLLPKCCVHSLLAAPPHMLERLWIQLGPFTKAHRTLCYAIVLPGRKSGLRAGCRSDSDRERINIGPLAGRRPAGQPMLTLSQLESGRNPARKPDFRAGGTMA